MGFAPSVDSLGAERLANHGMELRTPLITAPSGRYQGAPALIPAVRRRRDFWNLQSHPEPVTLLCDLWYLLA